MLRKEIRYARPADPHHRDRRGAWGGKDDGRVAATQSKIRNPKSKTGSRSMLDVMIRVRQRDAVKRQVGRDRMDQLPVLKQQRRIAAGRDDVGPSALLGRIG